MLEASPVPPAVLFEDGVVRDRAAAVMINGRPPGAAVFPEEIAGEGRAAALDIDPAAGALDGVADNGAQGEGRGGTVAYGDPITADITTGVTSIAEVVSHDITGVDLQGPVEPGGADYTPQVVSGGCSGR